MGVAAGPHYIDDTLTFTVVTHRVDTGALTDADAVPAYRIYEDETGTAILTGNTAKLDDANTTGFYSEQITLSAANGFEVGKSYAIYVSAAVNSVTGGQTFNFKVIATPTTPPTAAAIADAVLDEDMTAHQTQGSLGQAIGDPGADTNTIYKAVVTDATGATVGVDVVALKAETVNILADTNELQTDWANGGRLDLILDARSSQTSVDDLPTNAELTTALGTADDAVLAAIAALNNLSAAQVNAEVDTAITDAALATAANLATVDTVVDAIKAKTDSLTFTVAGQADVNIKSVAGTTVTGAGTAGDPWGP